MASVVLGLAALAALLAALSWAVGLSRGAFVVGLGCGVTLSALVVRAAARDGLRALGPADHVTLARSVLACGVAALTVELLSDRPVTAALLGLTVVALILDAVDGRVARRTGTGTPFGARFDGEADAFLILVLSIAVGHRLGWWVLALGLARYAFAVAGWFLPWMRAALPYRYWRKVVTATAGIALAIAIADVLPDEVATVVVAGALMLLAESFGRDVWWLWCRRHGQSSAVSPRGRRHRATTIAGYVAAVILVWFALLAPNQPDHLTPAAFLRLPVEAVVLAALVLLVSVRSDRSARAIALLGGGVLGLVAVVKVLDLGSFAVLDRPFNIVTDRSLLGSGLGFVEDSLGSWAARGVLVGAVVLTMVLLIGAPFAVANLTGLLSQRRRSASGVVAAVAIVWVALAVTDVRFAPGQPLAAADAGYLASDKVRATVATVRDQKQFDRAIENDMFQRPAAGELSGLRGKDVVFAFVESYGRTAVEGPDSWSVRTLLEGGTDQLSEAGYEARSAFLTSPTFGGSSWLAHATMMSGLWVDDQRRYDRVLSSRRTTITSAFERAGWRTVAVLPSNRGPWPEGQAFYRFDEVYDRTNLGYAGPRFGFSGMPDQFALAALVRLELGEQRRPPVMAEIALTSSHGPWAPLPKRVDPAELGDGSVFRAIHAEAVTAPELWSDRDQVPAAYRTSIRYSLTSVIDFARDYRGDRGLVVVLVGDHQPGTVVSGFGGNRDVPVTVIADDPTVIDGIDAWGWNAGLLPREDAPVWSMGEFRDRFLVAFGPPSAPAAGASSTAEGEE